ncbi:class I SAM-dependent methyltransferase [Bordetella genomosp. 9]|uniref:class I SAM-dependent methyltransferase n=1 Tax=Bordetella genomosp. 9 TaxID=1416803 RepID=UPI001C530C87|nr:class I SAM-dependent methyltransferase [Bordetella genomosp. 9]
MDGFDAYAPELAHGGGGFEASYFSELAALEDGYFWFEARNRLIIWAMRKYVPGLRAFLEVGCGTGYVLAGLAREFPQSRLYGSEIFTEGLGFAARRVPRASFMQVDARRMPFCDEFDAIGAFDVLEHIEEDSEVLAQLHNALLPGGHLLVTVPQHQWLWSAADERARHVRRYSATDMHAKLRAAGFDIRLSTSFVSLLLPVMYLARALNKKANPDPAKEFKLSRHVNAAFYAVMSAELRLIRANVRFPIGGSRLIVARKQTT